VYLGGALVTAGGLVFVAATRDSALRAFDVDTGQVLWTATLPAGGQATPMTYRAASASSWSSSPPAATAGCAARWATTSWRSSLP
jgi:quinoprotein glucose dehydrogenase